MYLECHGERAKERRETAESIKFSELPFLPRFSIIFQQSQIPFQVSSTSTSSTSSSTSSFIHTNTTTSSTTSTTSSTTWQTNTTTSSSTTSSTTLPPPPVRLVQPNGEVFNVGDVMPEVRCLCFFFFSNVCIICMKKSGENRS